MTVQAWVDSEVLAGIRREAREHPGLETGGLLMGYWQERTVVVTAMIGPGPSARRGATWFEPDSTWQEAELARLYTASLRTATYLGDWHTHPGGTVALSRRDRRTLGRIARTSSARQPRPLMGVVAPDAESDLVLWAHVGLLHRPRACMPSSFTSAA